MKEATLRKKYHDHDFFHWYNANPKGVVTGDCVIRALSMATDIAYNDVLKALYDIQLETGYSLASKESYDLFLSRNGWHKQKQPKNADNTKLTCVEFCLKIAEDGKSYVANVGSHHVVAIVDRQVWDIWDSSDERVGNYWMK